jgi:flagellar biosynthesis protein FlhF
VLRPDETHLVCSLTTNPRDTFEAMDHYLPLGVNRLTFTKLDEASAPGILLNVRMRCNQPLGYITCGQSVPEDIIPANRADFSKILLGA